MRHTFLQPVVALRRVLRMASACVLGFAALTAVADDAAGLRQKYAELKEPLANNVYKRAMFIDSAEQGDNLKGDVYAVLDHPFSRLEEALKEPGDWCSILILPFNTKYCHAGDNNGASLVVRIGRKFDQPVQDAYKIEFALKPVAATNGFFESRLFAKSGPLGTRDYKILVSAIPLDSGHTFMHLSYAYGYGFAGRLAMQGYLATVGASKVGFSVEGKESNGEPKYIGGVRGAIERTAMRYYLAIDAHLDSLSAPPAQQLDRRIQYWFNATEKYPRQLREMDKPTYVAMKKGEVERAQMVMQ